MRRAGVLVAGGVMAALAVPGVWAWQVPVEARQAAGPDIPPGRRTFEARCARCHGADGNGGEMGPPIARRLDPLGDAQLTRLIHDGIPVKGMPPNPMSDEDSRALVRFLRTLQHAADEKPAVRVRLPLTSGATLEGALIAQGFSDLQVRTADGRVQLLRRDGDRYRTVTSTADWPGYNGGPGGNRYTTLTEIDRQTVSRLAPRWMFTVPDAGTLQGTPSVVDGIMYVPAPNECYALDAGSGRPIWHFKRPRTKGVTGGGANRGVAVAGSRVFLETDDAHVLALDRLTGTVVWETPLADWRDNYSASSAPLVAGNLLIAGVSGGEHGANGFVAALDQATGKQVWRFDTVPRPGEPGSETWDGSDIEHGGAPTWFTGSYDPALELVYWPVGNPSKEYDGRDRKGDDLYANSLLALERRTGRLRWYYQFTPHDLWDWDATQTSVLVDAPWQGTVRPLLLHASRNGFFYVFDRRDGTRLLSVPFVRTLTWASRIGDDGRPVLNEGQQPGPGGTRVCPSQDGATNWFSPSFNPATGLYYVQTFEKCSIYTTRDQGPWESGKSYLGGTQHTADEPRPMRVLKAIDIQTGRIAWELPQPGPAQSWGGTLTTATGLVVFGEEGGALMAADARTGEVLWSFRTNQNWRASPMTYGFDGHQYIAVAAGPTVLALAIQE